MPNSKKQPEGPPFLKPGFDAEGSFRGKRSALLADSSSPRPHADEAKFPSEDNFMRWNRFFLLAFLPESWYITACTPTGRSFIMSCVKTAYWAGALFDLQGTDRQPRLRMHSTCRRTGAGPLRGQAARRELDRGGVCGVPSCHTFRRRDDAGTFPGRPDPGHHQGTQPTPIMSRKG